MENINETKGYRIEMREPADFDPCVEISVITTRNLSYGINEIFATAFEDYLGCTLIPMAIPNIGTVVTPYLYFKIYPKEWYTPGKTVAFRPDNLESSNMIDKLSKITNPTATVNKMINMTDDAKSAMKEFIPHNHNSKIDWNKMWSAKVTDGETIVCLNNTRIDYIVRKLYGAYDSENTKLEYQIDAIRPVSLDNAGVYGGMPQNFVLQIRRAKDGAMRRAADNVGMIYTSGTSTPMIKAQRH